MNFLKSNKRISFLYGGTPFENYDFCLDEKTNGNSLVRTYSFGDGLKVTNEARRFDCGAYEWVTYFENTSDKPSKIISELYDCHIVLPVEHEEPREWCAYFPDENKATKIYAPTGSKWSTYEFYTDVDKIVERYRINHIYPGQTKEYSASGGRSCEDSAPFFDIHKNGKGYIFAIGWTGQWNCIVSRSEDDITLKTKIEDTYFRILPGEKFRTSSIVILPYEGDFADGHNIWRRLIKNEFSLIGDEARGKYGPLFANLWGGMTTESAMKRVKIVEESELPVEYIWMDAGWYGGDTMPSADEFNEDWESHTGDWRISTIIHPNQLKDLSGYIHSIGKKFLLWVEPERVVNTTPIVTAHPEYFLKASDESCRYRLLDLGNPDAWKYCFNTIAGLIENVGIDCYRQDFNIAPLPFWRENDEEERKGIKEIKHINGLYNLLDALLDKFPHLLIDNCSSGGRRIDVEMLRRSLTLWRSDFTCSANYDIHTSQFHSQNYNKWMPYSGTSTGREYDEYRVRSAYATSLATNYSFSENEAFGDSAEKLAFLKKYMTEYLKIRPYLSEDYYPLTEPSVSLDVWCASQYNRPSMGDGIIQVFCRENAPYDRAVFKLRGLKDDRNYIFTDIDDDSSFTLNGKELLEKGLPLEISEKRKAKIYMYKEM